VNDNGIRWTKSWYVFGNSCFSVHEISNTNTPGGEDVDECSFLILFTSFFFSAIVQYTIVQYTIVQCTLVQYTIVQCTIVQCTVVQYLPPPPPPPPRRSSPQVLATTPRHRHLLPPEHLVHESLLVTLAASMVRFRFGAHNVGESVLRQQQALLHSLGVRTCEAGVLAAHVSSMLPGAWKNALIVAW